MENDVNIKTDKPQRLPVVMFKYNSTGVAEMRKLLVTDMTEAHLCGFDPDDNYQYKRFTKTKILNEIKLIKYETNPKPIV